MRPLHTAPIHAPARTPAVALGLRANLGQFLLLVLVNAFVGAMVGLERTVVPLIAQRQFGLASASAATSFIVGFGVTKALANLWAGGLSDRLGCKGVQGPAKARPSLGRVFALASWRDRDLFACSQAGLVNNLNDGLAWGLLPLYFAHAGLGVGAVALLAAAYPLSWGPLQLGTGARSPTAGAAGR